MNLAPTFNLQSVNYNYLVDVRIPIQQMTFPVSCACMPIATGYNVNNLYTRHSTSISTGISCAASHVHLFFTIIRFETKI